MIRSVLRCNMLPLILIAAACNDPGNSKAQESDAHIERRVQLLKTVINDNKRPIDKRIKALQHLNSYGEKALPALDQVLQAAQDKTRHWDMYVPARKPPFDKAGRPQPPDPIRWRDKGLQFRIDAVKVLNSIGPNGHSAAPTLTAMLQSLPTDHAQYPTYVIYDPQYRRGHDYSLVEKDQDLFCRTILQTLTLYRTNSQKAIPATIAVMKGKLSGTDAKKKRVEFANFSSVTRIKAARALGEFGLPKDAGLRKEVLVALDEMVLLDENEKLRHTAAQVLKKLTS